MLPLRTLAGNGAAVEFVKDMYRHCKAILALGEAQAILDKAGIPAALPDGSADAGLIRTEAGDASAVDAFIARSPPSRLPARNRSPGRLRERLCQSQIAMQVRELLLQALVHERGGTLVYSTALECAVNDDLREEWEKYLEQTVRHVDILTGVCVAMGLDPDEMTPGCQIVHHNGKSLVIAMKMARAQRES